uniref:Uncharacterized protein LOC114324159 n=1 Tax=Diabrotica virgifera virgifera TaxID=50390 RepID=A0A6P7EXJ3_DIAVI
MRSLILATIVLCAMYQAVDGNGCRFVCRQTECEKNLVCKDSEILVEHGTVCGCCDACYKKLYEGDNCIWDMAYSNNEKCADGLICNDEGKCAKVDHDELE